MHQDFLDAGTPPSPLGQSTSILRSRTKLTGSSGTDIRQGLRSSLLERIIFEGYRPSLPPKEEAISRRRQKVRKAKMNERLVLASGKFALNYRLWVAPAARPSSAAHGMLEGAGRLRGEAWAGSCDPQIAIPINLVDHLMPPELPAGEVALATAY